MDKKLVLMCNDGCGASINVIKMNRQSVTLQMSPSCSVHLSLEDAKRLSDWLLNAIYTSALDKGG